MKTVTKVFAVPELGDTLPFTVFGGGADSVKLFYDAKGNLRVNSSEGSDHMVPYSIQELLQLPKLVVQTNPQIVGIK